MSGATARDVMNADVLSVAPELTVHELATFLVEHQISGAPVVDGQGRLVGLVSLTDIAEADTLREDEQVGAPRGRRNRIAAELAGLRVRRTDLLVRDIMTPTAYSVDVDTPVAEMARTMIAGRIHRLLVMREGNVVGIVTSLDLLRLLVDTKDPEERPRRARPRPRGAALVALAALVGAGCSRAAVDPAMTAVAAAVDRTPATLPPGHPAPESGIASSLPPGHPNLEPSASSVQGTVTLAPALRERASAGQALFLIARSGRDRQIVAVRKVEAVTFPCDFELSARDAMNHGAAFGGVLEITARLSRSGDAAPAPGDVEGRTSGVAAGSRGVRVQLDRVLP